MKLKIDWKHVLSVVAVLALVGGGAGAIIGTVNAFTADIISSHSQDKETAAFRECFPDAASFSDLVEVTGKTYVTGYRSALDASGNEIGKGYVVTGASGFGAPINLIVGVNEEGLVHVNLVSYGPDNTGGTTNVIEGWIDSVNEDPANLENGVTTGATNSAGVIREMIAEALASYEGGGSTPLPDGAQKYLDLFEGATSVGDEVTLSGTYLTSYREVYGANNALLGRGYLGAGTNGFGVHIEILVGLDTNYAVTGMSLEDYSGGTPAETEDTIKDWIDSVNEDPSNFDTAPSAGASYATIQSIVNEAISDYQNGGSSSENQKYLDLFEGAASTGNEVTVTGDYITSYREVYDSANTLLGRAYLGAGTNGFGVHIEILVGLDTNYAVTGMSLEDYSGGNPAETEDTIKDWIDSVNEDPSNFETAPSAGASYATIQSIVNEAIFDYQNGGSSSGELTEEEQAAYDALLPDATWGDVQSAEGHDFVKTTRLALDDNGDTLATVYQATYEQSGDSLGILVSVDADKNIKVGYYTSSYDAAYVTGVKGWIEKINNGTVDYRDDIATSGCEQAAYSIAAMLDEVKEIAGITDPTENPDLTAPEEVTTMLPAASSWSEQVSISNVWYAYAYYSAYDAEGEEIGRVYAVRLETAADNTFYVALNADASFVEVKLISTALTDTALTALNEWISSTNSSKTLTAPDSENAAASEINSLIGAIEDAQRDYGVNVEEDISAKIGEVVAKNFGENAKYDTMGGNFTLAGTPEVGKTYYSVYVPSSDPLGGTPTYPGNVYVANIEEDSYSATLLISVGDLVTDAVSDVVSAVDVVSETGTRNEETVNRISTALVEYYKGTLPTDEPDEPVATAIYDQCFNAYLAIA